MVLLAKLAVTAGCVSDGREVAARTVEPPAGLAVREPVQMSLRGPWRGRPSPPRQLREGRRGDRRADWAPLFELAVPAGCANDVEVAARPVEPLSELAVPTDGSEAAALAMVLLPELVAPACDVRRSPEVAARAVELVAEIAMPASCENGGPEVPARAVEALAEPAAPASRGAAQSSPRGLGVAAGATAWGRRVGRRAAVRARSARRL